MSSGEEPALDRTVDVYHEGDRPIVERAVEKFIEFAVDGADRMWTMIDGLRTYSHIETIRLNRWT